MIEIFDSVAGIRSKRREAIAQLDILIQSIFWEMFGEPLRNPQGWDSYTLQEITIKITDGEHLNPHFSPEGIPIIMAGNVREDYIDLENAKKVDVLLGERFRKKCHPVPGDILLVSRGATIGRLCTVDFSDQFCLMGSVILIKLDHLMVESKYLESLLKHPSMYRKLVKTSASSAQQAIYLQDLKQLICMIPPLNIQQEFVYRVGAIAKLKNSHRASLEKLDALFASLQYQGFRGEL
jgi:type I restriction enzyme S subunit